jgi:hypothetical protein
MREDCEAGKSKKEILNLQRKSERKKEKRGEQRQSRAS